VPDTLTRLTTNGLGVRGRLAEQVRTLLAESAAHSSPAIVRASVGISPLDPLRWLRSQGAGGCIYWANREQGVRIAGLGEADVACAAAPSGLAQLADQLGPMLSKQTLGIRYYGGMRFEQAPPHERKWDCLGAYRFVLPRFELRTDQHGTVLYCNLIPARDRSRRQEILADIAALSGSTEISATALPHPVGRSNRPTRSDWYSMVAWALKAFRGSVMDKVVLAREASFSFSEALHPIDLLEHLAADSPRCFHYLIQPAGDTAFLGASPERLFRRHGVAIESEAVAGTRPLGASVTDDARLLNELLHNEKERREHEYVRVSLREQLQPLAEAFHLDVQPSEMKLSNGRHLVSRVRAILREGVTSLDVLEALHPTPAVGGYPPRPAIKAIRDKEPFDRGWYAGPVGWIGPNRAEFAVAIRSGLIHQQQLALYSGAGIVEGSTPQAEWEEIEHKIVGFKTILGLRSQVAAE